MINKKKVQVRGNKHIFLMMIIGSSDVFLSNLKHEMSVFAAQLLSWLDINTNCHTGFTASEKVMGHVSVWISLLVLKSRFKVAAVGGREDTAKGSSCC